jgi:hypothetical protein
MGVCQKKIVHICVGDTLMNEGAGELGFCKYFLRGWDCTGRCNGLHAPRDERPPCPRWLAGAAHGGCKFKDHECFFPHVLTAKMRVKYDGCRCALQVRATHAVRAAEYVRSTLEQVGLEVEVVTLRAHGDKLKSDPILMVIFRGHLKEDRVGTPEAERESLCDIGLSFDVRAWLLSLGAEHFLATSLVRCFVVATQVDTSNEALNYFSSSLVEAARRDGFEKGCGSKRVRVHAYPKSMESEMAEALNAKLRELRVESNDHNDFVLAKSQCDFVLSVVFVSGVFYLSVEEAETSPVALWGPLASRAALNGQGKSSAVCRAEHKLREVAARTGVFTRASRSAVGEFSLASSLDSPALDGEGQFLVAMDIGAAPGGWTACLLDDLGFTKVFSVDPADIPLADDQRAPEPAVSHLYNKNQIMLKAISVV